MSNISRFYLPTTHFALDFKIDSSVRLFFGLYYPGAGSTLRFKGVQNLSLALVHACPFPFGLFESAIPVDKTVATGYMPGPGINFCLLRLMSSYFKRGEKLLKKPSCPKVVAI